MGSANDKLVDYWGTSGYYPYINRLLLTDGSLALAEKFQCFWFLDVIASYQDEIQLDPKEGPQVWKLKKNPDGSADVICTDGNYKELVRQAFRSTDFSEDEATVFVSKRIAYLPSEH